MAYDLVKNENLKKLFEIENPLFAIIKYNDIKQNDNEAQTDIINQDKINNYRNSDKENNYNEIMTKLN